MNTLISPLFLEASQRSLTHCNRACLTYDATLKRRSASSLDTSSNFQILSNSRIVTMDTNRCSRFSIENIKGGRTTDYPTDRFHLAQMSVMKSAFRWDMNGKVVFDLCPLLRFRPISAGREVSRLVEKLEARSRNSSS